VIFQGSVRGKTERKSGVYALVNEHFERGFNEVMSREKRSQPPVMFMKRTSCGSSLS
jgi:hypothetical protein